MGKPQGIIASYKAGKVQREAVIEYLRTWYSAQLDATKHQLSEVARVRKAQATVIAEQFIRALDQRHLEYLTSLGLRNLEVRQRALIEVGDQTTAMLRELETRDWPQHLIDKTIQSVVELHARFFEKIMAELGQQK